MSRACCCVLCKRVGAIMVISIRNDICRGRGPTCNDVDQDDVMLKARLCSDIDSASKPCQRLHMHVHQAVHNIIMRLSMLSALNINIISFAACIARDIARRSTHARACGGH